MIKGAIPAQAMRKQQIVYFKIFTYIHCWSSVLHPGAK